MILLQLICLTALLQSKPDPLQALRQVFTWGNQAHNALLAFSVESFQHYAQTQLTAYISATILHNGVAVLSFLLTLLINVLCISLILTPGIPILCMVIGLLSGSFIGLKNLGKTLLTAHLQLSAQRKAMRKKGLTLQPAQKSYPFEQGWNIESVAAEEIANTFHKLKHKWSTAADLITDWKWKRNRLIRYWVRLIQIGCQIAGLIQSILALEIGALSACLYTTLLLLWDAGALLCIGVLSIMQVLHPRLHTHLLSCPSCHHEIAAPISICAACITECPQRRPGFYGIFWYRCQGCGTKLPTLDFYGSRSFTHLCPHCRHVLKP